MTKIIAIISFFLLAVLQGSCQNTSEVIIDADQMEADLGKENIVILDVRTPEEFQEGHIPGAVNLNFRDENFSAALDTLDKDVQYNIYCRSGNRTKGAAEEFEKKGFNKIRIYEGGLLNWEEEGKIIER